MKTVWYLLLIIFSLSVLSFGSLCGQKNKDYSSRLHTYGELLGEEGHLYELCDSSIVFYSLANTLKREYKITDVTQILFQPETSTGGRFAVGGLAGIFGGIVIDQVLPEPKPAVGYSLDLRGVIIPFVGFLIGGVIGSATGGSHIIYIYGDQGVYETKKREMGKYLVEF